MKRVNVKNNIVDVVEMGVNADASNTHPFVVSDDVEVFGGYTSNGDGTFTAPTPAPPTVGDVVDERERRFALGFNFDFGDSRGVHNIGTTQEDMKGWDEVTSMAQALINTASPTSTIGVATDTGAVTVTVIEWQQILLQAGAVRQPLWQCSFMLQALDPIPTDYATNDDYWSLSYWGA